MSLNGQGRRAASLGSTDPRSRRAADSLVTLDPVPPLVLDSQGRIGIAFDRAGNAWGLQWNGREVVAAPEYQPTPINTVAYTARVGELVLCDPSDAGFTVTLPGAAKCRGQKVTVKNASSSTNTITVGGQGMDEIDGSSTATITTAYGSMVLVSDGSTWHAV